MTELLSLPAAADGQPEPEATEVRGVLRIVRNRTLLSGLLVLLFVVLAVVLAPVLATADPIRQNLTQILQSPSHAHLLGTDELGRDIWARLLYAGRVDLLIGVTAVLAPFVIGTALGLLSGYRGGWIDQVIMRVVDIVVAFPFYILVIAVVFALGAGVSSIFIAITCVGWVTYARIVRGEVLVASRLGYIQSARAAGLGTLRILIRHLAPNVVTQAITYAMSDVVLTILAVVTLGYLGLGVQPPTPEWGSMMQEGSTFLSLHPLLATAPGIAVIITGLALSLIGDGIAQELNRG